MAKDTVNHIHTVTKGGFQAYGWQIISNKWREIIVLIQKVYLKTFEDNFIGRPPP